MLSQYAPVEGLDEDGVRTCRERVPPCPHIVHAGQHDDWHTSRSEGLPDATAHLGAVHARHLQVHQNGPRRVCRDRREGGRPIRRRNHPVPVRPQQQLEQLADAWIVVDHEHQGIAGIVHGLNLMRILLIEDNESNAYLAQLLLERRGHVVTTARTGTEGVRLAGRGSYDAILLDLRLPDGDGCDFVAPLVAGAGRVPVVAVSAHALAADHRRALEVGCAAFIEKPIDVASFVDRIEQIVAEGGDDLPNSLVS